jgi:HlyD family secretion protein
VDATGSIAPEARLELSFKSAGRVAEILVEEGEKVEAGEVLARLDTTDLEHAVRQAEAALKLAQVKAGARPEEIASAEANLAAAQGNLATAKGGLARAEADLAKLLAGATEREIEIARLGVDQAKNRLWGVQAERDGIKGSKRNPNYMKDSAEASVL